MTVPAPSALAGLKIIPSNAGGSEDNALCRGHFARGGACLQDISVLESGAAQSSPILSVANDRPGSVGAHGIDRIALFPAHVVLGFDLPDDWLELLRAI